MGRETSSTDSELYDAIVVGAGICGIIFLKYAREKGLRCLVLEKQSDVGGLWNWLPAWQDIQNRTVDFAINGVPLDGAEQPYVKKHVRAWVDTYDLDPFIRLECEVVSTSWEGDRWRVSTDQGTFAGRYLIAASGVQNRPWIPDVDRSDSDVVELHSSDLREPKQLAGKRVAVVGGGASAWDLLELAIENQARDIQWVYRNVRWFLPSTKSKQNNGLNDLRFMARAQTMRSSPTAMSAFIHQTLKSKYEYFNLTAIQPKERFDLRKHQAIPGRPLMVQNLDAISRHKTEIERINGRCVTLANGERITADLVLWGTGYRIDLSYLGLPEYRTINTVKDLYPKLGSLIRSIDYPNLFFLGMSLIESTSTTPFFAAVEAKSIVAHIRGKCTIPTTNTPHQINHWNLLRHFAAFDHHTYPKLWWKIKYFVLAWWYSLFSEKSLRV
jgi:cation diffusion facilitator CzcD-associated flavoprotein CzcO